MELRVNCAYDELWDIARFKPHPKNPNKHDQAQIDRLVMGIQYYGWCHPIRVSKRSGYIEAGHARLKAAKILGFEQVPMVWSERPDEEQEIGFLTFDNAIAQWAELDMQMINAEVPNLGPDFEIDLLGLKRFAIDVSERMVSQINAGDENSEWVDMPDFKPGQDYIRLVYFFGSMEEMQKFVIQNHVDVKTKKKNVWIVYP